jgi:hypothetical protein
MRHDEASRTEPDNRAKARGDHGNQRQVRNHCVPCRVDGDVGEAGVQDGFHAAAAARPIEQTDDRQSHVGGVLLGEDLLGVNGRIARAAADGEVIGADHHPAAAEAGGPCHEVGGLDRDQPALGVVAAEAGEGADLSEAAFIGELLDARAPSACRLQLAAYLLRSAP